MRHESGHQHGRGSEVAAAVQRPENPVVPLMGQQQQQLQQVQPPPQQAPPPRQGMAPSNIVAPDAAAPGAAGGRGLPAHLLPHRKPKNFADRLMRVLLNGEGGDTLWWVGNGKAVALHPKNLKRGHLLASHFNIKDYNAFIRNCNRWGFSRTNQYAVPDGVKVYQCSLFQRDAPHLMLHMRMDSDVQDVFMRQVDIEEQQQKKKKRKTSKKPIPQNASGTDSSSSAAPAPATQSVPTVVSVGSQSVSQQQGALQNLMLQLSQSGLSMPSAANTNGHSGVQGVTPSPGFPLCSTPTVGNGESNVAQGGLTSPPVNPATVSNTAPPTLDANSTALLQGLMQMIGTAAAPPAPAPAPVPQASRTAADETLDKIAQLGGKYLNHPDLPPQPDVTGEAIKTVLQLLQLHIKSYQEEKAEAQKRQQIQSSAVANELAPLLQEVLSCFQGNPLGAVSAPQVPPAHPPQQRSFNSASVAPAQAQTTLQRTVNNMATVPAPAQAPMRMQQGNFNGMPAATVPVQYAPQPIPQGSFNSMLGAPAPQVLRAMQGSFNSVPASPQQQQLQSMNQQMQTQLLAQVGSGGMVPQQTAATTSQPPSMVPPVVAGSNQQDAIQTLMQLMRQQGGAP